MKIINVIVRLYNLLNSTANYSSHIILLIIRLYWGWQFFRTGMGKLNHLDNTIDYFTELGIPAPVFNAIMAACTECFGGLFLMIGFAARPVSIALTVMMIVAYVTADYEALVSIFSNPENFIAADPFLFLLTSVIVFSFGAGSISLDGLLGKKLSDLIASNNK